MEVYPRNIPYTIDNIEKELIIYQESLTDVGGVIWDSALLTIHYFFKHPLFWKGKKVLELGSGTRVCGIALASIGSDVLATDLPERLSLIERNIDVNKSSVLNRISVGVLDWTRDTPEEEFDVVLAVDCIYYTSSIVPLINLFRNLRTTEIIVVSEKRDLGQPAEAQQLFFERIVEYFTLTPILKCELDPEYYADDIVIIKLRKK